MSGESYVNLELESFPLSRGVPTLQLFQVGVVGDPQAPAAAWLAVSSSAFAAGVRVQLTAIELLDFGSLCTRFGEALLKGGS